MHRPKANSPLTATAALLLLGILIQSPFVKAGFKPKCLVPDYWTQNTNKLKEAVERGKKISNRVPFIHFFPFLPD